MHPISARSRVVLVLLAFLVPFAALAARHWTWDPPTGSGDYAQYLLHARAIVEGRSYTDIGYIYHPAAPMLGPRAYPPGFPLTLVPLVAFAGVDSVWIRVLMLVMLSAFAYLAFRRLELDIAPWQAAVAAGFSAFAIEARFGTLAPISDPGFCAIVWATILAVDVKGTESWTWRRSALVTSLGFAAIAYRVAGIAIVPALALYALVTWRQNRGRALIPVAIWGTTGLVMLAAGAASLPFSQYLIPQFPALLERLSRAAIEYRESVFEVELYPFATNVANDVYHAVASVVLLGGVAALLWRARRTMLAATALTYSALLAASPAVEVRYMWPMYPVLAAGLVLGISATGRFLAQRVRWLPRSPLPAVAVLALIVVAALRRELSLPAPDADEYEPEARALQAWLRVAGERAALRMVTSNPRVLTLRTHVPAMASLVVPPDQQLRAMREEQITHLVLRTVQAMDCRERLVNALPGEFPDRFVLEYSNPKWSVYRLLPPNDTERERATAEPIRPIHKCSTLLPDRAGPAR